MAFDAIETPFGKSDKIIGGAATYIAWCASNFTPVKQISIVGGDFPAEELKALTDRQVDLSGVQIKADEKSFFLERQISYGHEQPRYPGYPVECVG
jgi:sugar/nucleoside kinase (ribokinase family)